MKRAIVVGASSHLGIAVCRELEKRGAKVAGTYFQGEGKLASVAAARRLDLTDAAAIPAQPAIPNQADGTWM